MTLDEAIETLKVKYEEAKSLDYVGRPISYALYHTWEEVDDKEMRRERRSY